MIEKIKNILINPKGEFEKMEKEEAPAMMTTYTSYSMILSFIPAICTVIGWGLIGYTVSILGFSQSFRSFEVGIKAGIIVLISSAASFFVSTYIVDALAPNFKATKNINRAAQLVAAVLTPASIAGIFCLMPNLDSLMIIGAVYGAYILYLGLPFLMKSPADQTPVYTIAVILVVIITFAIISMILRSVLIGNGGGFAGGF